MKGTVEKRKPNGIVDYVALALTTFGVGYIPGAPGTYGSAIGVGLYLLINWLEIALIGGVWPQKYNFLQYEAAWLYSINAAGIALFALIGIWAANRAIALLGNADPPEAVVDEVMGQLITFCFVPFGVGWPIVIAGFLLFRLFDIWKPFPVRTLEVLPGGLGICADDIVAGVYAGICLALGYAVYLSL